MYVCMYVSHYIRNVSCEGNQKKKRSNNSGGRIKRFIQFFLRQFMELYLCQSTIKIKA